MAENYVETFEVTDVEDNHYTVKAKDPEAVETAGGEIADTIVTYDNSSGDSIGSFTDFIDNFVSGTKIGRWFKNFKAGVQYILHVGTLVNNCVSDNTDMPLAAAQGKVLMDEITQLNSAIIPVTYAVTPADGYTIGTNRIYKIGRIAIFHLQISAGITATGNQTIGTFPDDIIPAMTSYHSAYCVGSSEVSYVTTSYTGTLSYNARSVAQNILVSGAYITAS